MVYIRRAIGGGGGGILLLAVHWVRENTVTQVAGSSFLFLNYFITLSHKPAYNFGIVGPVDLLVRQCCHSPRAAARQVYPSADYVPTWVDRGGAKGHYVLLRGPPCHVVLLYFL